VFYGIKNYQFEPGGPEMELKHIVTLKTRNLCESAAKGGCGECQTSCQSACKTSCGIANQQCENTEAKK
jgi:predicted ribosomally synthesized six-cysteine peptide SCIFF